MTTRIYIRGNVGDPRNLKIYDADTDARLNDVAKITITADGAGAVQANLIRHHSPNVTVDVMPGPMHPSAGRVVYLVSIDSDKRAAHCNTLHHAKVEERSIDDDGLLQPRGQTISVHDVVTDADLAQATNPRGMLGDSADRALTGALRAAIVKPKIDGLLLPAAGGFVNMAASQVPVSTGKVVYHTPAAPKPQCDECKGTGSWTNPLNNQTSPCSKGCKP